jgi:MFS family permease
MATLATFAVGFVVRPFGALFFGRLGDLIGRKYTFMVTLLLMGGATFLIGCVPSYETIGFMAPVLVLILRMLQGRSRWRIWRRCNLCSRARPVGTKGWTSWIQTTATVGLFISLMVILATRNILSPEQFDEWGWRVPFWVSIIMVGFLSNQKKYGRVSVFAKAKSEGKSTNPLKKVSEIVTI